MLDYVKHQRVAIPMNSGVKFIAVRTNVYKFFSTDFISESILSFTMTVV